MHELKLAIQLVILGRLNGIREVDLARTVGTRGFPVFLAFLVVHNTARCVQLLLDLPIETNILEAEVVHEGLLLIFLLLDDEFNVLPGLLSDKVSLFILLLKLHRLPLCGV